ncbi:MAG: hypothetical protein IJN06_06700 [Bacteroidales bacterium]|nr:hypothetical protein [Bacteroidales bacterium]
MITTEEIATRVYQMLQESEVKTMISGVIDYERNDYTKEDVIIVPHTIDGEGSVRFGQININIHVPDIAKSMGKGKSVHRINYPRLIEIRAKVIEVLQNHYEVGMGYNWNVGRLNPPIKEQNHDEHFVSLALELTVRNK